MKTLTIGSVRASSMGDDLSGSVARNMSCLAAKALWRGVL